MKLNEILDVCHVIAPLDCVWSGDNVGILTDRDGGDITAVLVALDVSMEVINEAESIGAELIISHHPFIFESLRTVTNSTAPGRRLRALIKKDIACICMHTNYDGAVNGLNDELAKLAGLSEIKTLINKDGKYGRYGVLEQPSGLRDYAEKIKTALGCTAVRAYDSGRPVNKVCVGSGGSGGLFPYVLAEGCDTFITGDIKHDLFCDARDMGLNLIDAGHFATEDIMCKILIESLSKLAPGLKAVKSKNSVKPYFEV